MESPPDYTEYYEFAIYLAKEAGKTIKEAFYKDKVIERKDLIDLVTDTDTAVENFIFQSIKQKYPTHQTLGEESFSQDKGKDSGYPFTDAPTWIVDPIDGTTNFVHRYPFVCVSIALSINKQIVVGVVYNPIMEELFHAVRGKGAFLNDKKIEVSRTTTIHESVVATNVGYDRSEEGITFMTSNIANLLKHNVQSMRSQGTSAMDLCGIACGRLDAFWEFGIHPWDIAAGVLILEEANGVAVDPMNGNPLNLLNRRILAGNKHVVPLLVDILKKTPVPEKWAKL